MYSAILAAFTAEIAWQLIVTFVGVFAAALLAWWIERRKENDERRVRAGHLARVLVGGIERNLVVIRRIKEVLVGDGSTRPSSPSQRLVTAHFDATIVSGVELLEKYPEEYDHVLNAAHAVNHVNRRIDVIVDLELRSLLKDTGTHNPFPAIIERHREELLRLIQMTEPMLARPLEFLGGVVPREDSIPLDVGD